MASVRGWTGRVVAASALVIMVAMLAPASAQWTGGGGGAEQGKRPDAGRSNESNWHVPPPSASPPQQSAPQAPPQPQQAPAPERPAWMAPLTERDKERIADIVESRTEGRRRAALDTENRVARAAVALIDLDGIPIVEKQLLGAWQCRTYSLGGTLYPNRGADVTADFRCRVDRDKSGLVLKKLTGSVTWLARLTPITPQSMLYYGTYAARGEKNIIYPSGDPYRHQVGILQQIDRYRFRLEMPKPTHYATSDHDLIELFREN